MDEHYTLHSHRSVTEGDVMGAGPQDPLLLDQENMISHNSMGSHRGPIKVI